jgi:hypothetical protein
MWWKLLAAYLAAFVTLLWGVYHFARFMDGARAPARSNHPDNR